MAHVEVGFLSHVDLVAGNASRDDGVLRDREWVADQAAGNRRGILVAPEQEDRHSVTPLRVSCVPFLGTIESKESPHLPAGQIRLFGDLVAEVGWGEDRRTCPGGDTSSRAEKSD